MKLVFKKSDLLAGVNIVLKAVPNKTTMSILECIMIEAADNEIKFTTTDSDLGIETKIMGEIIEEGSIAIDAKIFSDIIRKLPDNEIVVDVDENCKMTITCENSKFNIIGKTGEDFAYLPSISKDKCIYMSQFTLKEVIRQTSFCVSETEHNKLMSGELFEVKGNQFKVVALDRFRIAIRNIKLKDSFEKMKAIVPGKTLNEISKILTGGAEDEITIYFTDNHIMFEFDSTIVISRLIEGEYFKINQMLSSDYETKVTVNKKELLDCIDRATLLIKEGDNKPIIMNIGKDNMELKINSFIGSMNEFINMEKEGKDLTIGFNPKFLIDTLRVIDDETVDLYMVNSKNPCFIRDIENKYIYLILPVAFNN
ncbi:MAG: DNA polymerase III subunit beta [Eubacterium sp.]